MHSHSLKGKRSLWRWGASLLIQVANCFRGLMMAPCASSLCSPEVPSTALSAERETEEGHAGIPALLCFRPYTRRSDLGPLRSLI